MVNSSLAAQAVARGPATIAPPSFDGHGWLVAINLGAMTAATMIAVMVGLLLLQDGWVHRWRDRTAVGTTPAKLWRRIGLLFSAGIFLRCGVEALSLWAWNPLDPARTGTFLFAKRLVDPIAVTCGVTGLAMLALSLPGMMEQMRKEPLPIRVWQSKAVIRRMLWLLAFNMAAAIAVVSLR